MICFLSYEDWLLNEKECAYCIELDSILEVINVHEVKGPMKIRKTVHYCPIIL